jgi:predicted permease
MRFLTRLWRRKRSAVSDEVDGELAFHLEMRRREAMSRGLSDEEARRAALEKFGDVERARATCEALGSERDRGNRIGRAVRDLWRDTALAVRQMAAAPGFTFVAVATLTLGIGATTAIFSAVRAVVLQPLSVPEPDRLMLIGETWRESRPANTSAGNFVDMAAEQRTFTAVAAARPGSMTLARDEGAERILGSRVSGEFFAVFGVQPALGRVFGPAEDEPGRDGVVVLGHRFWSTQFGGDRQIIGQTITVDARPRTVVGVMPASFDFTADSEALWMPIAFSAERKAMHDEHYLDVYGRLKPGVTIAQARADLDGIGRGLAQRFPRENGERSMAAISLMASFVGDYRERLFVLFGAVGLVLLIACGNVSNLLIARGTSRGRELALRSALGAGRGRLVRQLIAESLMLGLASAVAGVALAYALIRLLVANAPTGVPRLDQAHIDLTALAFAVLAALSAAVLSGLMPAWRSSKTDVTTGLKEAIRGAGSRTSTDFARGSLIAGEIALALMLLVGAGLLIRSAIEMQRRPAGFNANGVLSGRFSLAPLQYTSATALHQAARSVEEAVRAIPGVTATGLSTDVPGYGGFYNGLIPEGEALESRNARDSRARFVTPGFFKAMELPIVKGHAFTDRDRAGAPLVMIVNQTLAEQLFPGKDPIGRRVTCCDAGPKTIVGVAMDVRAMGPAQPVEPEFYLPLAQIQDLGWTWTRGHLFAVARTDGDAAALMRPMRTAVNSVNRAVPLFSVMTMDARMAQTTETERFHTYLLALLGAIGLVLASIGIYGVIACFAAQRTPEIGIRIALGASRASVIRLVVRQAARPVLAGLVAGTAGAALASRFLESQLVNVRATDASTYAAVTSALLVAALAAALVPARRAATQDPARILMTK